MKNNLVVVSLSNNYSRQVGKELADFFEMFYVDLNDILEYNLINNKMLETAGKEYFDKERKKIINSVTNYENSLIVADIELLLLNNNFVYFKNNFLVIYLYCKEPELANYETSFKSGRNLYAFKEEDEIVRKFADVIVDVDFKTGNLCESIKNAILKYAEEMNENWWYMRKRT